MIRSAGISSCGRYRYTLTRIWDTNLPMITWVMLNPSTADHFIDDQTVRKCIEFSRRWGFGGIRIVNLFALRATNPEELRNAADPVGPRNRTTLKKVLGSSDFVTVAWGANVSRLDAEDLIRTVHYASKYPRLIECLGRTKKGHPRHPVRLSYETKRAYWRYDD